MSNETILSEFSDPGRGRAYLTELCDDGRVSFELVAFKKGKVIRRANFGKDKSYDEATRVEKLNDAKEAYMEAVKEINKFYETNLINNRY